MYVPEAVLSQNRSGSHATNYEIACQHTDILADCVSVEKLDTCCKFGTCGKFG